MKELSIEQKTKAYDEAVINGSRLWECGEITRENYEYIFPELKESEDERIRKAILELVKQSSHILNPMNQKSMIAWLEKQGDTKETLCDKCRKEQPSHSCQDITELGRCALEKQGELKPYGQRQECVDCQFNYAGECKGSCTMKQKPTDNVEPKFKIGNWYQCTKDFFGKGVTFDKNTAYYCAKEGCLQDEYGCHIAIVKDLYDNFKLWTIQDAKAGDVLATLDYILVFKEFLKNNGGISYCHYDFGAGNPQFIWLEDKNWYFGKEAIIHPATKEQRDLLFQNMKEAGYEWDAEKKELKKIEQEPAWSEEDEYCIHQLIVFCENCMQHDSGAIRCANWLKSLKDRVQPKKELSEEDKTNIDSLLDVLYRIKKGKDPQATTRLIEQHINFIKSLKERYTWKPSAFHLECIEDAIAIYEKRGINAIGLKEILEELKKLKN